MYCYYCDKTPQPGAMRFEMRQAIGVCHDCGAGVCAQHGEKSSGQPLLCAECAEARRARPADSIRQQAA